MLCFLLYSPWLRILVATISQGESEDGSCDFQICMPNLGLLPNSRLNIYWEMFNRHLELGTSKIELLFPTPSVIHFPKEFKKKDKIKQK